MSLLGIDLGTTGIKCVAYSEDGKNLGRTYREYELYMPKKGIVELDPNRVWSKLCSNLQEINSFKKIQDDPIEALSISVSGDEALPVNKKGIPLYNTIMAMDKRGEKENNWINQIIGSENLYKITGQPPSNLYPLNKIIWFKENKPEIFHNTYKFLCWEEFMFQKFGAEPVTDYSVACRTLAFDIIKKDFSEKILKSIKIDKNLFPRATLSGTEIGKISKKLATELGFKKDVAIVTGGFDQVLAALGSGIVKNGMASVCTGTMELMQVCFKQPVLNTKMMNYGYPFCNHVLDNLFITLSINYCGGVIFKWYRNNFSWFERKKSEKKNIYDIIMDFLNICQINEFILQLLFLQMIE